MLPPDAWKWVLTVVLLLGVACDLMVAAHAKRLRRPYGPLHLILSMLLGWIIIPIGFIVIVFQVSRGTGG